MTARALIAAVALLAACRVERRPPSVMVRVGDPGAPIHRAVILPSECATQACKGLDAIVAAELAFRGIDLVDLDRIAALERKRTEVDLTTPTGSRRLVEVSGPLMSDVDVWTMRGQLAAMGVDAIVRTRSTPVEASPARVAVLVRVTRVADASLVWASLCEIEPPALSTLERSEDQALRCALRGAPR